MASEIIESDKLHLFLLSDGSLIDENQYLESLEIATELIVCTEEQFQKLPIYLELITSLKHLLSIKRRLFFYDAWLLSGWLLFNFDKYLLN